MEAARKLLQQGQLQIVSCDQRLLGRASERSARDGLLGADEFVLMMADTLAETTHWGCLKTDVAGYVGIDTLQEQIRKNVLRRGFEFNIVVVGELSSP